MKKMIVLETSSGSDFDDSDQDTDICFYYKKDDMGHQWISAAGMAKVLESPDEIKEIFEELMQQNYNGTLSIRMHVDELMNGLSSL